MPREAVLAVSITEPSGRNCCRETTVRMGAPVWQLVTLTLQMPSSSFLSCAGSTNPTFQSGTPHALFDTEMVDAGIRTGPMSWDIAPDGKRFLIISDKSQETSSLNVILNWRPGAQK